MRIKYVVKAVQLRVLPLLAVAVFAGACADADEPAPNSYEALAQLFEDWREFERPPMRDHAPDDATERFSGAYGELKSYRACLNAIGPNGWPIEHPMGWHLVRAEMDGFNFNHGVPRPWARGPAFYQSVWTSESGHADPFGTVLFWRMLGICVCLTQKELT